MRRPYLLLIAGLLDAACSESPYSPAPSQRSCGAVDFPCPFDCKLGCASIAVRAAASCVLTLEGVLDATRTSCSFADGSRVVFHTPVPSTTAGLRSAAWDFGILRGGQSCLDLRMQPPQPEDGLLRSQMTVSYPGGEYAQAIWSPAADGGLPGRAPQRAQIRCADGRTYAGEASPCYRCDDRGGCTLSGVLELRVLSATPFEFSLASGDEQTPLFTCR